MADKPFSLFSNSEVLEWLDRIELSKFKEKFDNKINGFDLSIAGREDLKNEFEIDSFHYLNNLCKNLNISILDQSKFLCKFYSQN
jgi:hypothetical protein